jgi:hypothetical protein
MPGSSARRPDSGLADLGMQETQGLWTVLADVVTSVTAIAISGGLGAVLAAASAMF